MEFSKQFLNIQIHGAKDHSGGVASNFEDLLLLIEKLIHDGPIIFFPGLQELPNIHPIVVHFPIALLSIFLLLDLIGSIFSLSSMRRAAGWFLYIGSVSALLTVAAGFQAAASVPHGATIHAIMETHKNFGIFVASLSVLLSVWRIFSPGFVKGFANFFYQLLSIGLVSAMMLGADLGGLMVYKYGAGVANFKNQGNDHNHDHNHSH